MTAPNTTDNGPRGNRASRWLGLVLLVAALACHLLAARAIGGSNIAYRDHLIGFFGFALLSGAVIALLGRRLWKGRPDITLLVFGALQALLGLYVYIERFNVHG